MLLLLPACACISTYMYICIKPCFYDFWQYHPYILQHLNGNVFTLVSKLFYDALFSILMPLRKLVWPKVEPPS